MFDRMAKGWELAKASLYVLRMDKELLVFPLVSSISGLVSSTLDSILLAALYMYAAEGQVPQYFDKSLFEGAFARK